MSLMDDYGKLLRDAVAQSAESAANQWLHDSLDRIDSSSDPENDLLTLSAMARRKLGSAPLGEQAGRIETPSGPLDITYWERGDAGRILFLLRTWDSFPETGPHWVDSLFRHGNEKERCAIVRALVLFPSPESFKEITLEAGRCNSLMLYSALALKNPYPAAFYEEHEYNQIVLKSLFTGLNIALIVGLQRRSNRELSRMCEDYADERLAAGRTLPNEIWLAIGPHASEHGEQLMLRFLNDDDALHRYYSAMALVRRVPTNPGLAERLAERLSTESEPEIRKVLEKRLAN